MKEQIHIHSNRILQNRSDFVLYFVDRFKSIPICTLNIITQTIETQTIVPMRKLEFDGIFSMRIVSLTF